MSVTYATPYISLDSKKAGDTKERKQLSIADDKIGEYRFRKLKFLVTPLLPTGGLRDADSVVRIYELLTDQYEGDFEKAASELYGMLRIVGLKLFSDTSYSSEVWDKEEFQWRVKLIECSDRAIKQNRDSKLVDRLFNSYDIDVSKDRVTSSLMLFEYMIDHGLFKPGQEKDLERVEDIFSFCKNITSFHYRSLGFISY